MWVGDYSNMNRPLPIPNREVKHIYADDTAFMWESRTLVSSHLGSSCVP